MLRKLRQKEHEKCQFVIEITTQKDPLKAWSRAWTMFIIYITIRAFDLINKPGSHHNHWYVPHTE